MTEAATGVFHVQSSGANWQLLVEDGAVTLVDSAFPRDFRRVEASLNQIGRSPADVAVILLTHAHRDHLGTAAEFRRRYGTPIRSSVAEAPHVRGDVIEEISAGQLLARLWRPRVMVFFATALWHGAMSVTRLTDVGTFGEGAPLDVPGHPVPIATPGHTSGHCSFHLPDRGVILAGDAFATLDPLRQRPMLGPLPRVFDHDAEQSVASLRHLATLDARVVLPGHGPPFNGVLADALERELGAHV